MNVIDSAEVNPAEGTVYRSPRREQKPRRANDPYATLDSRVEFEAVRLGSYRIVAPIAMGAMGQVFLAIDEATGQTSALKLVRRRNDAPVGEKQRMLFLREMSILSRLHHHRIVKIHDFGSIEGQLFMSMEYVKTIDLRRELFRCPMRQQVRLVSGIGCYMLDGLAHAHAKNIVHRDIKPANLLVYRNESNKIGIKLADFGISKDTRHAGMSGMTGLHEVRGTPAFMSPEQLCNSRDAGPDCDIYSAAAVLYFYLTGKTPHQLRRHEPAAHLCRIVQEPPVPLSARRGDLPSTLCNVIERGLAPARDGRYQSAVEFNQALLPFTRKDF